MSLHGFCIFKRHIYKGCRKINARFEFAAIKLLASLKKKQFDSREFRVGKNGALYDTTTWNGLLIVKKWMLILGRAIIVAYNTSVVFYVERF